MPHVPSILARAFGPWAVAAVALASVACGGGSAPASSADAGASWTPVEVEAVGRDTLLGVTHLEGTVFAAYGAFGL
jgi:hypothetical protein